MLYADTYLEKNKLLKILSTRPTKVVNILLRDDQNILVVPAVVDWTCPSCRNVMNEPIVFHYFDEGISYSAHNWGCDCGVITGFKDLQLLTRLGFISWQKAKEQGITLPDFVTILVNTKLYDD